MQNSLYLHISSIQFSSKINTHITSQTKPYIYKGVSQPNYITKLTTITHRPGGGRHIPMA